MTRTVPIALALALAACGAKDDARPQRTPEAGFVVMKTESVPLVVELAGRTVAFESADVRPQVTGVVKARLFQEGTIVQRGQTLYQIDPSLYSAAVSQARANLQAAQATAAAAKVRADRLRPLADMEAVSRQDYTDAVATAGQTAAQVAQTRAALETADVNLRFTKVPAPITGRIGRSLFTVGALVTAGQADPLAQIQRLDPMFVDIQQSSAELLALRRSLAKDGVVPSSADVRLLLEDGSTYGPVGRIQFAEAVVNQETGAVTLRARFPNPQGLLLPGMYVRARLSQATDTNGILVPQTGVARDPDGSATVMLVGPGNKAVRRAVRAERTVGDKWLVTDGLKPGDKVITEGLGQVRPDQAIIPVPAGSPPRPRPQGAGAGGQPGGSGQAGGRSGAGG